MPRKTIYAYGLEEKKNESLLFSNEEDEEEFLDRVMNDTAWAKGFYSGRNLEFDRMEKWFFGEHYETPIDAETDDIAGYAGSNRETEHLVTLQLPFTSIVRAHTVITNEFPAFEVLGSTSKRANSVEKFLYGVHFVNKERWGSFPMNDAIFNQLLYGWGVVRVTWSRNEYKDPMPGFDGDAPHYQFPIQVESINPREVFPVPGGTQERWRAIIHETRMSVVECNELYGVELQLSDAQREEQIANTRDGLTVNLEPLHPNQEVAVQDYWCWEGGRIIHATVANDQFVIRPSVMKEYDQLPFVIFFCMQTTVKHKGEWFGLSANHALINSVREMEWLATRWERITELYAEPVTVIINANDDPVRATYEPGEQINLVEGESAYYLEFRGTLPDVPNLIRFFQGMAEEDAFTIPREGTSGLDTLALQQAGMIKIFKPVENAEQAYEAVNSRIIGLLQRCSPEKKVNVYGRITGDEDSEQFSVNLSGKDTKGMRQTLVRIRAKFPMEELRNVAAAATLKNSRLMQTPLIQKRFLNIQDTAKSKAELLQEDLEADPTLRMALVADKVRNIAEARSNVMAMVAEEAARLGGVPAQGTMPQDRAAMSQMGGPENNPPLGPQESMEQMEMRAQAEPGIVDNPLAMIEQSGGVPLG